MIIAILIGTVGGLTLLAAGYLLGARRGAAARQRLREQVLDESGTARVREELGRQRAQQDDALRADLQRMLGPLLERERLTDELGRLERSGRRRDLTDLLDQIAERGPFTSITLNDEDGWPLATNRAVAELDRLTATASVLQLLADRLGPPTYPPPTAVVVQDAANRMTLSRLFTIGRQRFTLTADATGVHLGPSTLDPALGPIAAALTAGLHVDPDPADG